MNEKICAKLAQKIGSQVDAPILNAVIEHNLATLSFEANDYNTAHTHYSRALKVLHPCIYLSNVWIRFAEICGKLAL